MSKICHLTTCQLLGSPTRYHFRLSHQNKVGCNSYDQKWLTAVLRTTTPSKLSRKNALVWVDVFIIFSQVEPRTCTVYGLGLGISCDIRTAEPPGRSMSLEVEILGQRFCGLISSRFRKRFVAIPFCQYVFVKQRNQTTIKGFVDESQWGCCCHSTWPTCIWNLFGNKTPPTSQVQSIPTPQSPLTKVDYQRCDWSLKIFEDISIFNFYTGKIENNIYKGLWDQFCKLARQDDTHTFSNPASLSLQSSQQT